MLTKTLIDTPDYRITLHQVGSQPTEQLIVTFGGQPSGLADRGFGSGFCQARGWDSVYVAQREWSQYQGLSLEAFKGVVSSVTAGRDVIAYGASLGGYAALYYGGSIDARILAGSPMQSVWPPMRTKRFAETEFLHAEMTDVPKSAISPEIIYDPMREIDQKVVDDMVLKAYPEAALVKVPYAGHKALLALQRAGILSPLVEAFVEQGRVIEFSPPGEGTATFHFERGKKLIRTNKAEARRELEKSFSIDPRADIYATIVNLLVRMGDLSAAQNLISEASSKDKPLKLIPSVRTSAIEAGLVVN